jgi:hypothetical protein
MKKISASVGQGGRNKPTDVVVVQVLLNANGIDWPIDGEGDSYLAEIIKSFQGDVVGVARPDGKIDFGGRTWKKLNAAKPADIAAAEAESVLAPIDETTRLVLVDSTTFVELYEREYSLLGGTKRTGLIDLIGFLNGDQDVVDVRWGAYMLATVKHECAETWQPIEEYGKGSGKDYGNDVTVTDADGKKHTNKYYGRGYVQLTWQDKYKSLGAALGLGDDLMIHPEKALEKDTAYKIMSYGMRNGSFTTAKHKLADYISGKKLDYRHARRIINGLDQANLIKGYAETLQLLLLLSLPG